MKKILLAVLCLSTFALTSCEELVSAFLGEVDFTITDGTTTTPINCSCSIGDAIDSTTLLVGSNVDLTMSVPLDYPYTGVLLNNTEAQSYDLTNFYVSDFNDPTLDVDRLLTEYSGRNLVAIALNDTSWYLSIGGTFNVTNYPAAGGEITGNVSGSDNLIYVTKGTLMACHNYVESEMQRLIAEGNTVDQAREIVNARPLSDFFPVMTISGNIKSRRMNVRSLYEELQNRAASEE